MAAYNKIRLGLVSQVLQKGDKQCNLSAMEQELKRNKNKEVDLFVFPEVNINGGLWRNGSDDYVCLAESIPDGKSCKRVMELAKEYDTTICAGLIEREDERYYITHFLCSPNGYMGKQRKIFSGNTRKRSLFTPGKGISKFNLLGQKCAILSGGDFLLPETCMMAGLAQCSFILSPSDCYNMKELARIKPLLAARAMNLGASAAIIFGHDFSAEGDSVAAAVVCSPMGDFMIMENREITESKTIIFDLDLHPQREIWGSVSEGSHTAFRDLHFQ